MMVLRASHANLLIAFSMHSISMPESFISMRCCWSIGNQNFFSLDYGVEPSVCFKKRFIKSRSSMEVTDLQKLEQKMNRVTLLLCLLPIHNYASLQKKKRNLRTVDAHVLFPISLWQDGPCCFNLNWFNPMPFVKSAILQQYIIHIHPCLWLVALLIAFFPWNQNSNHCYQKERTCFTVPLPNAC